MLEHGGRLNRAAAEYGIPRERWLDLSTGVSPHAWSVPVLPGATWHRLPEEDDGLLAAASAYYGTSHLLPVAGTQAAIGALPRLRAPSRVGVIRPGYAEHAQAWERAGHAVRSLPAAALLDAVDTFDVIVLIHPNNPGGERFGRDVLMAAHAVLAARGGWLVVDEAFMDPQPEQSLCAMIREGLVVLRSVGKFFGLAGARAGFVAAWPALIDALDEALGPWTLTGPTRHVVARALADRDWQATARERLRADATRLATLLMKHGLPPTGGCELFQYCECADAFDLHRALASRGVLTRYFAEPSALRFGLPGGDIEFDMLSCALAQARR